MQSFSLKQALAAAEKEAPASVGGGGVFESGDYEFEIVDANTNFQWEVPQIGIQVEVLAGEQKGKRRWLMNLKFDDSNAKQLAVVGRKLTTLGLSDAIDKAEAKYPEDVQAQLTDLAASMKGIKFIGKIDKVEKKVNGEVVKDTFVNFWDVKRLLSASASTASAPVTGLLG